MLSHFNFIPELTFSAAKASAFAEPVVHSIPDYNTYQIYTHRYSKALKMSMYLQLRKGIESYSLI